MMQTPSKTPADGIEPITGNYMFSLQFIALTATDIMLSIWGTERFILDFLLSPRGSYDLAFQLSATEAAILYVGSALCFFPVGILLLHQFHRDLRRKEVMPVSAGGMLLALSPPYFVVPVIGGLVLGFGQGPSVTLDWILLFSGPCLGLFISRFLYFLYESRFWRIEPVPRDEPSRFRVVDHYVVSRQ
jgi:hypothetical protein